MGSLKPSNGSLKPTGMNVAPGSASRLATPTLPSFLSKRSSYASAPRDHCLAAGGCWQPACTRPARQQRAKAAAKADARRGGLGRVVITVFIALTMLMAASALHREARLNELELREVVK